MYYYTLFFIERENKLVVCSLKNNIYILYILLYNIKMPVFLPEKDRDVTHFLHSPEMTDPIYFIFFSSTTTTLTTAQIQESLGVIEFAVRTKDSILYEIGSSYEPDDITMRCFRGFQCHIILIPLYSYGLHQRHRRPHVFSLHCFLFSLPLDMI